MNRISQLIVVIAAFVPISISAQVAEIAGDPAAGKVKAEEVCAPCHGVDGNAIVPEYPDLAGQNAQYLALALLAYKDHQRIGGNAGLMIPQAEPLNAQEIADLAAYYSGLESSE